MLTGFPRTRWPRLRFSESYAMRISVKISRICEFRVIMGIMTGLLGCCSSSTLGSRANDYVKTLATLGFWLHHSPCSLGCWTNNTLAARSLSPKHDRVGAIFPGSSSIPVQHNHHTANDIFWGIGYQSMQFIQVCYKLSSHGSRWPKINLLSTYRCLRKWRSSSLTHLTVTTSYRVH